MLSSKSNFFSSTSFISALAVNVFEKLPILNFVDEGIILEDDCLPSQSFFWFCQEMLDHFRNDQAVGAICGFYSNELEYKPVASYFFSRYLRVWGWAGWRRSIEGYSSEIDSFLKKENDWGKNIFSRKDVLAKKYWKDTK